MANANTSNTAEKISSFDNKNEKSHGAKGTDTSAAAPLTGKLQDVASNITDVAQDYVGDVKDYVGSVRDYASDMASKVQGGVTQVPGVIRRYPMQSMLVGFGLGFLAAMLVSRSANE